MRPIMRLFGRSRARHPGNGGNTRHQAHRLRVETRAALIDKFDMITLRREASGISEGETATSSSSATGISPNLTPACQRKRARTRPTWPRVALGEWSVTVSP
jgi:hypothetical protein